MKTQNKNKLEFSKSTISELNDKKLKEINGGTASGQTDFFTSEPCMVAVSITTSYRDPFQGIGVGN
ncbi:class I lanthipeptide [Lacinutrix neustonica]|uniref:Class I lanthipeptide n=1 Tax=Lacinutrix neustonica TaxID=2980107 RepID=A0A9E8SCT7_9FLAO|nr:class I lanthipeptide [Lacinutrix neustonica]WAC01022.1 class I lanthipeptide [Lacinutrix neustonica]